MILFMRHGETVANADGYLAGETDVPLSLKGHEQAKEAAKNPIFSVIQTVMISSLSRTSETLQHILEEHNQDLLIMSLPLLDEAAFSNCKTIDDFFTNKGIETVRDVKDRIAIFTAQLSDYYLETNRAPLLIIGHKWWYFLLSQEWQDLIEHKELDNCEIVDITNLIVPH